MSPLRDRKVRDGSSVSGMAESSLGRSQEAEFITTGSRRLGDKVFEGLSRGAGIFILVVLAGVATFLVVQTLPILVPNELEAEGGLEFVRYTLPLVFGTVWAAALALLIAMPLSIAIALFISHYAPRGIARTLGYVIDLLAAVPSVVYGLWGIFFLAPLLGGGLYPWLEEHLGFIPFFAGPAVPSGRGMLTAGVVLAVMILPVITAISREVFLQVPELNEEAALALGATRWEVIRYAVLPFGRSGIISAAMLGLGRALGETIAVAIVLSATGAVTFNTITAQSPRTIAANIALDFPERSGLEINVLIGTGLVLFIITFAVNYVARSIATRKAPA